MKRKQQMNTTNQFQTIRPFLADHRLITILEKMFGAVMAMIEID
jgi:hypothetical protein